MRSSSGSLCEAGEEQEKMEDHEKFKSGSACDPENWLWVHFQLSIRIFHF